MKRRSFLSGVGLTALGGAPLFRSPILTAVAKDSLPGNAPLEAPICAAMGKYTNPILSPCGSSDSCRGVSKIGTQWEGTSELKVFLAIDDESLTQQIMNIADVWTRYANIRFVYGKFEKPDIWVSLRPGAGGESYVGRASAEQAELGPTLWIGKSATQNEKDLQRTVLHEFGHALGLEHEHENPHVQIPWNKPAVYKHFEEARGWDQETVDLNVFDRLDAELTDATSFDTESIMLYPIPPELLTYGPGFQANYALSSTDQAFIALLYPSRSSIYSYKNYKLGVEAYERGRFSAAFRAWIPLARMGLADAQVSVGHLYQTGKGVAANYKSAAQWYGQASEQGNAQAMVDLGMLYSVGHGVPRNGREALRLFQEAADRGSAEAMYRLGNVFEFGIDGLTTDYGSARKWYGNAAKLGNYAAREALKRLTPS